MYKTWKILFEDGITREVTAKQLKVNKEGTTKEEKE
jgi:hypothetical protein